MKKIPEEEWPKCCICGKPKACSYEGKQYCNKHWQSMYHYGQPYGKPYQSKNKYEFDGEVLKIITKKGETILADKSDYDILSKHTWCISKTGYPVARINQRTVKLHRVLLNLTDPSIIADHRNRNTLDNRRCNLRICTAQENARNKSGKNGYIGIRKAPYNRYEVRITHNYQTIHVGYFRTLDEALEARRKAEEKYHGEFGNMTSLEMRESV